MTNPSGTNGIDPDERFNFGLLDDVLGVLRAHGYAPPEEGPARFRAYGSAVVLLMRLCAAYEGTDPQDQPEMPAELTTADLERMLAELDRGTES